jgi:hypothetical protein
MKAQERIKQYHSPKLLQVGELSISLAKVGKGNGSEGKRKKGDGHDRLLRNNLDGTLDLDILVSDMVTRTEMNYPHQAY